jgi:hypothetical protein
MSEPYKPKTRKENHRMKKLSIASLLAGAFAALPVLVSAQPSAHYVPGVEGIKGSSLPPPGVYVRDYNLFYFSDRMNNSNGDEIKAADADAFIYANVPRVLWITDTKFLGGNIGVDALLPLKYTSLEAGPFDDSTFGIGDLFAEATLSWHVDQADFSVAYGVWAPTGDFSETNPTRAGSGFWTHMFTAGMTWYMDPEKKWALSALSRYEINHEQEDTDITPGQAYTLEWGASYAASKIVDVGVVGYWQLQTTKDSGSSASDEKDQVVGIGPEVSAVCPKLGVIFSFRYLYEVMAENRLQGHTCCLTLTKRF